MKSCAVVTFGCKVNQYDSQAIRESCQRRGLQLAESGEPADVYIVNTCSVTAEADKEALRAIRRLRRRHPDAEIVVTGCLVDRRNVGALDADLAVPTRQKHAIAELLTDDDARATFEPCFTGGYNPAFGISRFDGHTRAFIKVQDGCNYHCSFCKIPQVRGRAVSRPMAGIVDEAERLAAAGYKELVITGVSLGNFGKDVEGANGRQTVECDGGGDGGRDSGRDGGHESRRDGRSALEVADIVEAVCAVCAVRGVTRLRLSSIEPQDVTDRLLRVMAAHPQVCRHLHLPLQSGSTGILERMRRHYTQEEYIDIVARARRHMPSLGVTMDVIVGFPGETDDDLEDTVRVMRTVEPVRAHLFPFSLRNWTYAASMGDPVPQPVIRERMARLRRLQEELTGAHLARYVGSEMDVLVEGSSRRPAGSDDGFAAETEGELPAGPDVMSSAGSAGGSALEYFEGYTDTYVRCVFRAHPRLVNTMATVRAVAAAGDHLRAEVVVRS